MLAGFYLRVYQLGAEGLSEDELNKLYATQDYRAHGLTATNGEHPFLMKALQTTSLVAADRWNAVVGEGVLKLSVETALRLPSALFGAFAAMLVFLVSSELFGTPTALIAAALWALDPAAIAFNRIAKEDTFFVFFFLLAAFFWLRSQRAAEGDPAANPEPYYWAAGAALGAMLASKYIPHFIAVFVSYNYVFQLLPARRWRIGRTRYLRIFAIMGLVFLLCNPTILLPATWREMFAFAGQRLLGHDGYEFWGRLYTHKFTDWLRGIPWYFYFVFMAFKLPPLTVVAFLIGLPLLFWRRVGDGRYFLLFWMFYWAIAFVLPGGKFTRYFTTALPAVLITAALGAQFAGRLIARLLTRLFKKRTEAALDQSRAAAYTRGVLALLLVAASVRASLLSAPHYRLYTNLLGGGFTRAGDYFPHDEFYDAAVRAAVFEIARRAAPGARVASETPALAEYYARRARRTDLRCVPLSDRAALAELSAGDFLIAARGRRYFSNDALLARLRASSAPALRIQIGPIHAADIYALDAAALGALRPAVGAGEAR